MVEKTVIVSDDIQKAAAALKNFRPAYAEMLNFYEQVFTAQEASKNQIDIAPIQISDEMLSLKTKEKFPLIDIAEFVVDMKSAHKLFIDICKTAKRTNERLADAAQKILDAINGALDPKALFTSLLNGDDKKFEEAAKDISVTKNVLAFITYSSIKPSLTLCAEQLSSYLDNEDLWSQGYCPICGSPPVLSILAGEGERFLICSFCWHKWPVKRAFCPFCNTHDNKTFHYFFSEEEKEYRVYTCDSCKKYIKTIDTRKAERAIYPPLEQVVTLHLDMKASEMGYKSGLALLIYE
jgi:FdhE protein